SSFITTTPPRSSSLFPYTTLFRSERPGRDLLGHLRRPDRLLPRPLGRQRDQNLRAVRTRRGAGGDREPAVAASPPAPRRVRTARSEEHTSELQSRGQLVCRLLLEK